MSHSFFLLREDGILYLKKRDSKEKICTDFLSAEFQFRLKTLSKSQPLFKAIGIRKDLKILDATVGLGKDAVSFSHLGAIVTAVEENKIIFELLEDGLKRASLTEKIKIHLGSCLDFMRSTKEIFDIIYLDPMYPETSKSAKPKKEMQLLREFLKPTENVEELLELAFHKARDRVVIKRPLDSTFLLKNPTHSFKSKLVRFDMYKI